MQIQKTNTQEEFLKKCQEFIDTVHGLDFDAIEASEGITLDTIKDLRNFIVFSCPELVRLSRIALTLTAQ